MATFESNTVAGGPAGYSTTSSLKGLPSTGLNDKLRQALMLLAQRRVATEQPYRYPTDPRGGYMPDHSTHASPANHGNPFDELNSGHTYVMGGGAQDTMEGHYTQGPNTNVVGGTMVAPTVSPAGLTSNSEKGGGGGGAGVGMSSVGVGAPGAGAGYAGAPMGMSSAPAAPRTSLPPAAMVPAAPGAVGDAPPTGGTQLGTPAPTAITAPAATAAPGMPATQSSQVSINKALAGEGATKPTVGQPGGPDALGMASNGSTAGVGNDILGAYTRQRAKEAQRKLAQASAGPFGAAAPSPWVMPVGAARR